MKSAQRTISLPIHSPVVVWAGLGGTETGNAIADIIYGDKNPSGPLPYTVTKSPNDYSAKLILGGNGEEILNVT